MQVLNYVLEPFPWLLMAVYELSQEQQKMSEKKNSQEDGTIVSWLAQTGPGLTSASELSSAEGDAKPEPKVNTSGTESQGEQQKKKAAHKPKKMKKVGRRSSLLVNPFIMFGTP